MTSGGPDDTPTEDTDEPKSLLEFPCAYPLKVMGAAGGEFQTKAFEIVRRHVPDLNESTVETRTSQGGRYVSYTFRLNATSRSQLDRLYTDLNQCKLVKAVL
jgi:hypothetical protein